jgi:protein-tyrosine-phosphatase
VTEGGATKNHTKQILFVCTANVYRSPAEAIFNAQAEERRLAYRAATPEEFVL